jgi:colicin import membrane protein
MARPVPVGVAAGWDPRFTRMVGVSACAHAALLAVVLVVLPRLHPAPPALTGYTVELTDPSALGGKPPPGRPDQPLGPRPGPSATEEAAARMGEPAAKPEPPPPPPSESTKPEPAPKPPEPAKEPPKPVEPAVKLPSPEKPPPPKPEAKKPPEPKPEPPKPEATKPEPSPKPEPKAAESPKPPASTAKPAEPKPTDAKPAGAAAGRPDGATASGPPDAYTAAAQKWRAKGATGGGGGLGGSEPANGPAGLGGYGGGGQVVGAEFIAYVQRLSELIRAAWVSPVVKSGLTAKVRCAILPNGAIASVELAESSGDANFDTSVLRAVRRAAPLPPPPARYLGEFREGVVVNFNSDDLSRGAG